MQQCSIVKFTMQITTETIHNLLATIQQPFRRLKEPQIYNLLQNHPHSSIHPSDAI